METESGLADRPDRTEPPTAHPPQAEPATGRALWPTFLRRTLAEDALSQGEQTR